MEAIDLKEKEIIKIYNFYGNEYKVNQFGDVYGKSGNKLKQRLNDDGYAMVYLSGNNKPKVTRYYQKVHRIVAECFIEKPNVDSILEVDHIDFNRSNNYYKNLRWVTHLDNVRHSIKYGRHENLKCVGEDNIKSKLTESDVKFIRNKYKSGYNIRKIYNEFFIGIVSETSIENICKYKTWKHID